MSVYFITCREIGLVKIGHAGHPRLRFYTIQTHCPHDLELEAVIEGNGTTEAALHRRFHAARARGEWFRLTPEIEALIAANPVPAPAVTRPAGNIVERIIAELGGDTVVSNATGIPIQTVNSWKKKTPVCIPHWRRQSVIDAANRMGKPLSADAAAYLASSERRTAPALSDRRR